MTPAPTPQTRSSTDAEDAQRYRRLRVLGCAVINTSQLADGMVSRFTNLDAIVDADLASFGSRGEAASPQPVVAPSDLSGAVERLTKASDSAGVFAGICKFYCANVRVDDLTTILAALRASREDGLSKTIPQTEAIRMAYKTGYQEGVADSGGMFDRESCEEGWGQYSEVKALNTHAYNPDRLPTVDDGRGGRRSINPQDDR